MERIQFSSNHFILLLMCFSLTWADTPYTVISKVQDNSIQNLSPYLSQGGLNFIMVTHTLYTWEEKRYFP